MRSYTVTITPDDGVGAETVVKLQVDGVTPRITKLELTAAVGQTLATSQLPAINLEMLLASVQPATAPMPLTDSAADVKTADVTAAGGAPADVAPADVAPADVATADVATAEGETAQGETADAATAPTATDTATAATKAVRGPKAKTPSKRSAAKAATEAVRKAAAAVAKKAAPGKPAPEKPTAKKTTAKKATTDKATNAATTGAGATKAVTKKAGAKAATGGRAYRTIPGDFAAVYQQAVSVGAVADYYGVPRHTAQNWVATARRRDLIPAGSQRRKPSAPALAAGLFSG